jgi:hypothetical protein
MLRSHLLATELGEASESRIEAEKARRLGYQPLAERIRAASRGPEPPARAPERDRQVIRGNRRAGMGAVASEPRVFRQSATRARPKR